MKLLLVGSVDAWTRSVATIHHWIEAGRALGHDVKVFGEPNEDLPKLPFTTEVNGVDLALFIVQVPGDFPEMPHLARLLDTVPREKRAIVDLWGRFNDTIRVEHDFNHLERLDGHQDWEWQDAIRAVSDNIFQPALKPRPEGVRPFLFHGFDKNSVAKTHASAKDAAAAWREKPYGAMYVGSNWQRWSQMRPILEDFDKVRGAAGTACLIGWDWGERPEWAVQKGIMGVDADPAFLQSTETETRNGVRFDEIVDLLCQAKFAPVIHRPLFRELGFVTNRSFETFYADTLPVLMLPKDFVEAVYGKAALKLTPDGDVAAHLRTALQNPEPYWDALFATRAHLAREHSYARRFSELASLTGAAR